MMDLLTQSHGLSWIALEIFKFLPNKDLGTCRLVSRTWKDIIDTDIHWWRLQIDNVFKKFDRAFLPNPKLFRRNVCRCNEKMWLKVFTVYPDLKTIFEKALEQKLSITKKLAPKINAYDYYTTNDDFTLPMHYAATVGDIEFMKLLHEHCNADYNEGVKNSCCKCTPLDKACEHDQVEMVEFLFQHIEDERQIKSAFLIACMESKIEIIEKFVERALEQGTKLDETNCRGENGLHIVTRKKRIKHAKLLLKYSEELGIDVNANDNSIKENTPFHLACAGPLEMVQLYVTQSRDTGIDLNKVDAFNSSGLSIACEADSLEVIDYLLEKSSEFNIDLNSEDVIGRTAFMRACEDSRLRLQKVKKFIRHADHIDLDNSKYGILSPALEKKDVKLFELLINNASKLKIDVNATDHDCRGYLHHLCDCTGSSPGIACLLLNCPDIDLSIKDNNGKTPLDLAKESNKRILTKMITKRLKEDEEKQLAEEDHEDGCPAHAKRRKTNAI